MDRTAAIAEIKRGVGFRPTQETTIIAALQSAQRDLETGRTLPEWLLVYDAPIVVTGGTAAFTLPSGFLRMHEDYQLYYINSDGARVFLPRRGDTEAYQAFVASGEEDGQVIDSASTFPKVWVKRGRTGGILVPTPTASFTAYMTYYKGAELLTSNVENAWLSNAPDLIIGLAGIKVAGMLRDKDALNAFTTQYKLGQGSFMGEVIEDELQGRGLIMGRNN